LELLYKIVRLTGFERIFYLRTLVNSQKHLRVSNVENKCMIDEYLEEQWQQNYLKAIYREEIPDIQNIF